MTFVERAHRSPLMTQHFLPVVDRAAGGEQDLVLPSPVK